MLFKYTLKIDGKDTENKSKYDFGLHKFAKL